MPKAQEKLQKGRTKIVSAQRPRVPTVMFPRHDRKNSPRNSQQYSCLNKKSIMTPPIDMPGQTKFHMVPTLDEEL